MVADYLKHSSLQSGFTARVPILRDYTGSPNYVQTEYFDDPTPPAAAVAEYVLGKDPFRSEYVPQGVVPPQQYVHQFKNIFFVLGKMFTPDGAYLYENVRIKRESLFHLYIGDAPHARLQEDLFAMKLKSPTGSSDRTVCIDKPCMPFSHPGFGNRYGHLLLENLPQLWILSKGYKLKLLLHPDMETVPEYLLAWVKPFGLGEEDFIIPNYSAVCKEIYAPSRPYMQFSYISVYAKVIWKTIANFYAKDERVNKDLKIYVSRAKFPGRKLLQEAECEWLFRHNGFEIIHPEEMSAVEQIDIFSRASHIAGPVGSGLHNVVFSRNRGVKTLVLMPEGFPSRAAVKNIEAWFSRPIYTIYGQYTLVPADVGIGELYAADWTLDMEDVERGLVQWLALSNNSF